MGGGRGGIGEPDGEALDVGGHVHRPDVAQGEAAVLAPVKKPRDGAKIGLPSVLVPDLGCEKFEEAFLGSWALGDDEGGPTVVGQGQGARSRLRIRPQSLSGGLSVILGGLQEKRPGSHTAARVSGGSAVEQGQRLGGNGSRLGGQQGTELGQLSGVHFLGVGCE